MLLDTNGEKVDDGASWIPVVLGGRPLWAQIDTGGGGLSSMTSDVFSQMLISRGVYWYQGVPSGRNRLPLS